MYLSPADADRLRVFAAAELARRTLARGLRLNAELIHVEKSPVGYTAYPMPVGATGNILHINLEMNF